MVASYVAAFLSLVVAAGRLLAPVSCELCPNGVCPPPQIGSCPENLSLPCVPKCCPLGQSLGSDQTCQPSASPFRPYFSEGERTLGNVSDDAEIPELNGGNSHLLIGDPCHNTRFRLEPHYEDTDEFHVLRNGSLSVPYLYPDYYLTPHNYCLETFYVTELEGEIVLPLVCFEDSSTVEEPFSIHLILYPIGLLISVPFLVSTMLVYCLIPQLRDLHGKTLSCHVMCLAAAYVLLAIVQLGGRDLNDHLCTVIAFLTQFTFQACFFWLQVMCFDTLWVISSSYINKTSIQLKPYIENKAKEMAGIENETFDDVDNSLETKNVFCLPTLMVGGKLPSKSTERRVFLCYSIYAWCWPIILIIVSTMIDLIPTIPSSYIKPNFGHVKCWYSSQEAELNYFYGPIIFVLVTNMIMFVLSALMIWKSQWQEGSGRTERQTFRLSFSLFFVMGINWIMEVISWAAGGPKHIWYVTDTINTLQGVIIFAIFVLDKRVRELVQRQLWPQISQYLCKCRKNTAGSRIKPKVMNNNGFHHNVTYTSVSTNEAPKSLFN